MFINLTDIMAILREEDIEGLIAAGAPHDEYDTEATEIANALSAFTETTLDETAVVTIMATIWSASFNLDASALQQRMNGFHAVARRVMAL